MLTKKTLQESQVYKDYIRNDKVSLIHNVYYDSKQVEPAFIVIHCKASDVNKWDITRFFIVGEKIEVSIDYSNIPSESVFGVLLNQYSRGL